MYDLIFSTVFLAVVLALIAYDSFLFLLDKSIHFIHVYGDHLKHKEIKKRDTENCLADWAATDPDYKNGLINHE